MARIVVVEDEAQVLLLAESVLEQAGHEVVGASTFAEAEAIINSDEPFDLVFTDVQLGKDAPEGGLDLGKMVADKRKGTPVLYTSGRPDTEGMRLLFVEPSAFLPKLYTAQDLTEAVGNLLNANTRLD